MPVQVRDSGQLVSVSNQENSNEDNAGEIIQQQFNEHINNIRNLVANIPEGYRVYIGKMMKFQIK